MTLLSDAEFLALMTDPAHPRDMTATCPQCGTIAFQRSDAEQVLPEPGTEDGELGAALQYTCEACQSSYSRAWVAGPYREEDLLRILDRRPE